MPLVATIAFGFISLLGIGCPFLRTFVILIGLSFGMVGLSLCIDLLGLSGWCVLVFFSLFYRFVVSFCLGCCFFCSFIDLVIFRLLSFLFAFSFELSFSILLKNNNNS